MGGQCSLGAGMILSNVRFLLDPIKSMALTNRAVWDLRAFKKPLAVHDGLTTLYPGTNAIFSPDDKYIVTGAGAREKGGHGRLMFLSKSTLEPVQELLVDSTPVKVVWHSKINQVRWLLYGDTIDTLSTIFRSLLVFPMAKSSYYTHHIRLSTVRSWC